MRSSRRSSSVLRLSPIPSLRLERRAAFRPVLRDSPSDCFRRLHATRASGGAATRARPGGQRRCFARVQSEFGTHKQAGDSGIARAGGIGYIDDKARLDVVHAEPIRGQSRRCDSPGVAPRGEIQAALAELDGGGAAHSQHALRNRSQLRSIGDGRTSEHVGEFRQTRRQEVDLRQDTPEPQDRR